mmetsp:Transcript_3866/g.12241  ORF Transcript_3866/g.12241 Transcript_3866/m.12241 type:complete len:215 (+) Transcript_3866:80-724(+)
MPPSTTSNSRSSTGYAADPRVVPSYAGAPAPSMRTSSPRTKTKPDVLRLARRKKPTAGISNRPTSSPVPATLGNTTASRIAARLRSCWRRAAPACGSLKSSPTARSNFELAGRLRSVSGIPASAAQLRVCPLRPSSRKCASCWETMRAPGNSKALRPNAAALRLAWHATRQWKCDVCCTASPVPARKPAKRLTVDPAASPGTRAPCADSHGVPE